jgi:hypothetical protein
MSDKSIDVNRTVVKFTSKKNANSKKRKYDYGYDDEPNPDIDEDKSKEYELTTLERIEVTLREVAFDNNYLGVGYKNAIAATDDYVKTAKNKYNLLKFCSSVKNCLKPLNKDEKRMAKNAVKAFDGLIDAERFFRKGDFLQAVLTTAVLSSAHDVRAARARPFSQKKLKRHNGVVLTEISNIGGMANMGRIIHDRVGRTRKKFDQFINSESFKRVDKLLMARFPVNSTKVKVEEILRSVLEVKNDEGKNLITEMVDWLSSLDYKEERLVEDTLANLMLLSTYIGSPELVYGEKDKKRFEYNSVYSVFDNMNSIIKLWPFIQKEFPLGVKFINIFKPINTVTRFFKEKLLRSSDSSNSYYVFINTIFSIVNNVLFLEKDQFKGLDFLVSYGSQGKNMKKINNLTRGFYNYLDLLHGKEMSGKWFINFADRLHKFPVKNVLASEAVRDYLLYTTIPLLKGDYGGYSKNNYHYDEPASIISYLSKRESEAKESNFVLAMDAVFHKEFDNITSLLDELFATIKVN